MIVLNGQPFVRYNLRALYPFAHEIVVVEGASPSAACIATPDGHSTDDTLEELRDFKAHEDTEKKLVVITAEDEGHSNGFWPGEKNEQSQAYARRATGDYLWQVDVDEFYKPEDMRAVLEMLRDNPQITAVSFKQISFWGGFDYTVDSWYLRRDAEIYRRLFKWGPGYQYITHRPPTVQDAQGCDVQGLKCVSGYYLARQNIFLYHYSLLFPKQVIEKCEYYSNARRPRSRKAQQWAREVFLELRDPYRAHNVYDLPGWLDRFTGNHPFQIEALRADLEAGRTNSAMRSTDDIECLLRSPAYWLGRTGLKLLEPLDRWLGGLWRYGLRWLPRLLSNPVDSIGELQRKMLRLLNRLF